MAATIEKLQKQAEEIRKGTHGQIRPGQPYRIPDAAAPGDEVWQGDLGIVIAATDTPPPEYEQKNLQFLVPNPDNTQGSRHSILNGRHKCFYPEGFSDSYEGLEGPFIQCETDVEIDHPVHGNVTIPAGMCVNIRYQREWDEEQKRERRNAD